MARKNLLRDLLAPVDAEANANAGANAGAAAPASRVARVDSRQLDGPAPRDAGEAPGKAPAEIAAETPAKSPAGRRVDSRQPGDAAPRPAQGSPAEDAVDSRQLNETARRPKGAMGAIGAVGRSIAELRARALVDLDPHLIDAGGLTDRLEHDEADHVRLMASLRAHGQQVPILVRPRPGHPGRYQIVYGRRRVLALRDLGQTVKALVRELDEAELVMAQGQENSARRDLSFIEKANFARQMMEGGFERKPVMEALTIDKTVLSRMVSVTDRVPAEVIAAIGAAPSIGRDRWLAFADLYAANPPDTEDARDILAISGTMDSDARFEALWTWLRSRSRRSGGGARAASRREIVTALDGTPLAEVIRGGERKGAGLALKLCPEAPEGFGDWLVSNLAGIHEDWLRRKD